LDLGVSLAECVVGELNENHTQSFSTIIRAVDKPTLIAFMYTINQINPSIIPTLIDRDIMPRNYEVAAWLCHKWGEASRAKPCAVINRSAIDKVLLNASIPTEERKSLRTALWPARGSLYFDEESFMRRTQPHPDDSTNGEGISDLSSLDKSILPRVRMLMLEACRLEDEIYEAIREEVATLRHSKPELPVFFE
jgi:hypothetical protein